MASGTTIDRERERVREIRDDLSGWRRWGPYVSDRSWGTVREDYSHDGNAWAYLTYDKARAKAYRWGEDGIAGLCDRYQLLCFAPAFWNERDPHLKERLFGVNPYEGNHGEDVKEYYFHVDNTPSHSYMCLLYKYPQAAFPYRELIEHNQRRAGQDPEYELLDTGVFEGDRYFDIFIEYAKADPEDLAIRITAHNRGPDAAPLHILPTLWFRNTWAWGPDAAARAEDHVRAGGRRVPGDRQQRHVRRSHHAGSLPARTALPVRTGSAGPVHRQRDPWRARLRTRQHQPQAAHQGRVPPRDLRARYDGGPTRRLRHQGGAALPARGAGGRLGHAAPAVHRPGDPAERSPTVDTIIAARKAEADAFYAGLAPREATADEQLVQRRALAGLLWSKQSYLFDVARWLDGDDPAQPPPPSRRTIRNSHWRHLNSMRVMSMPDKWEYPWFAAWDLAFQCVPFALVDAKFAKDQLWLLLFEQFQHPSGQLPAYEWEFGDLNPPVHAWAVWRVYNMDRIRNGHADREWLERCFHKLLINFASWVNKVDRDGNNVFEGGFLGLDNITVIDRSEPSPGGAVLEQSDATGWMGMFCLNLMRIALELARDNPVYEGMATKFLQHYVYVAYAMKHMGGRDVQLFDSEDGFFYDVLRHPDGSSQKFRVRSLVGLIPLFAVERLELEWIEPFKEFTANLNWFLKNRRHLVDSVIHPLERPDGKTTYLLDDRRHRAAAPVARPRARRARVPVALRHPLAVEAARERSRSSGTVAASRYEPAESVEKLKGGNSNWRGPIWFPTTFLIIESLRKLGTAFGSRYLVETSGSGGQPIALQAMARDIARRMIDIFLLDKHGRRPVYGGARKFTDDPNWRDQLLFYEYFHGDNGAGIGASHQTGWTALVANLIDEWR